jgi:hypothetical protein
MSNKLKTTERTNAKVAADAAKIKELHQDFGEALDEGDSARAERDIKKASAIAQKDPAAARQALADEDADLELEASK